VGLKLYGLTGKDGLLKYPVYECTGNHDRWTPLSYLFRRPVIEAVRRRHGGLLYSWDFGDVHLVSLDLYPDLGARLWLRRDLAAVGRQRPVVIFFHYPLAGLYSKWWSPLDKSAFRDTLAGFNVVGIFHGHYHHPEHYTWNGYDVYNTGSCRHWPHAFSVVRITDDRMTVAARSWDTGRWLWWHDKRINPETSAAANQSAKPPLRR
jgi:cytolysin (calcineurin-like family phosphatase)